MKRPTIGIIIPCRNAEKSILKTLESIRPVLGFSKVLCVDGFSSDQTVSIIEGFNSSIDNKIEIIFKEPNGVYGAMNYGITNSNFDYIYFLNSDDTLLSDTFQYICNSIILKKPDMIVSAIEIEGKNMFRKYFSTLDEGKLFPSISHQQVIFRRSIYSRFGLYNENLRISADYEFFNKILKSKELNTLKIEYLSSSILVRFYQGGLSSTSKFSDQFQLFLIEKHTHLLYATLRFVKNVFLMLYFKIRNND